MMLPVIEMPDLEMWATGWVRSALTGRAEPYASGVTVDRQIPNPRPTRLVALRHDGGARINMLRAQQRLSVNVLAATEQDATNLARLVEGLLLSVVNAPPVSEITSLSSPSRVDDTVPRRYFTVQVLMKGAVA